MEKRVDEHEDLDGSALCCCEYFDRYGERYHMLECCCNCIDFDSGFDRLICCRSVSQNNRIGMLLTFQDRLRIPWQGGAKQISLDTVLPIFAIPFVLGIAAINLFTAIIMFIAIVAFLAYSYYCLQCTISRSRFFFMWTICSVIYMIIIFEITVPLLEILPEENYSLILFLICATFCLYKTKRKSKNNIVLQSLASKEDLPDIDEEQTSVLIDNEESDEHNNSDICQFCRKYVPPRTFHCLTCQSCIIRRDHHNYWLDCCIGLENYRYYYAGLWFSMLALFLTGNLIMTSVCHPLLLFTIFGIHILLPDDCTEVFDQYEMSLAFCVAIYACLAGIMILIVIIAQTYLISKGLTLSEWRQGQTGNRKGILWNLKAVLCWIP